MDEDGSAMAGQIPVTTSDLTNTEEDGDGQDDDVAVTKKGSHPRQSRKRTKTGCLTCRRRRIKCGEERPTCGNCIKSKRQCEGYNQRVVFKDPLNAYRVAVSTSSANPTFPTQNNQEFPPPSSYGHFQDSLPLSPASLPNIAPKPTGTFRSPLSSIGPVLPEWAEQSGHGMSNQVYAISPEYSDSRKSNDDDGNSQPSSASDHPLSAGGPSNLPQYDGQYHQLAAGPSTRHGLNVREGDFISISAPSDSYAQTYKGWRDAANAAPGPDRFNLPYSSDESFSNIAAVPTLSHQANTDAQTYLSRNAQSHPNYAQSALPDTRKPPSLNLLANEPRAQVSDVQPRRTEISTLPADRRQSQLDMQRTTAEQINHRQEYSSNNDRWKKAGGVAVEKRFDKMAGINITVAATDDMEDDDIDEILDVSSDEMNLEEYDYDPEAKFGTMQENRLANNDLGIVVALQAIENSKDLSIRTYRSFINGFGPDMLATYIPSSRSSPLSDNVTARIFCHFINVLGPSISMYERHPANPSLMFRGVPVPKSQQHIWSYTMPTLALANEALLHSMLALATLHIARLQNAPITASLRHYHIAIRRVARSISLPTRRGQPATLAATLLLGFYEVMSADLNKWSNHLLGAKHLLKEIDFAGVARYLKTRKEQAQILRRSGLYHHEMALGLRDETYIQQSENYRDPVEDDIDENLVGMIMGKKVYYDRYGHIIEDSADIKEKFYSHRELEIYENQRDLFWWFAKQDVIQSILSGNKPFLDYDLWSHCPPRAPVGRRDAVYGTFDHVILLLGRLCTFTAKDLKRKRKVMQANGGQWRPPAGMQAPGGPPAGHGKPGVNPKDGPPRQQPQPQMPPFVGMMPHSGEAKLPRGFSPMDEESPNSVEESTGLREQTLEAEEEWREIRNAFAILEDKFGPDFQPLGPEYSQSSSTPFGPVVQYRTYSIAGVWLTYYMGLIVCYRAHPSMPPAALVAAGVAAQQTASYANDIGRIAAGIAPDVESETQVNIGVGSGLMDSALSLFVAGVQVQNPLQRAWIVQRMLDIARLTGWETATQSAKGCEASWEKAAEMGRGPPYVRTTPKTPPSVHLRSRRVDDEEDIEEDKFAVATTERIQYAVGLLGVEDELKEGP